MHDVSPTGRFLREGPEIQSAPAPRIGRDVMIKGSGQVVIRDSVAGDRIVEPVRMGKIQGFIEGEALLNRTFTAEYTVPSTWGLPKQGVPNNIPRRKLRAARLVKKKARRKNRRKEK